MERFTVVCKALALTGHRLLQVLALLHIWIALGVKKPPSAFQLGPTGHERAFWTFVV